MKKGKGLKTKLLVGVIGVGVITGGGIAFANTDAGQQLRTWYEGQFAQTVETIEAEADAYVDSQMPGLEEDYEEIKTEAQADIDATRETETTSALDEVINAKMSHLDSLSEEEQAILQGIGQQFYDVFLDGYFEIQALQEEGLEYASTDLAQYTGEAGQEAMESMTTDLNTARDEAVQELEEAIRQAQDQLAAELDNQEEITVRNLQNQVDFAINDLRAAVNDLLDTLVEEQQQMLVAKAEELEADAKAALDDVISGINE